MTAEHISGISTLYSVARIGLHEALGCNNAVQRPSGSATIRIGSSVVS